MITLGSRVTMKSAPKSGRGTVERVIDDDPSPRVLLKLDTGLRVVRREWDLLPYKEEDDG